MITVASLMAPPRGSRWEGQFALQDACSSRPPPASEAQGVGAAGRGAASDPREGPSRVRSGGRSRSPYGLGDRPLRTPRVPEPWRDLGTLWGHRYRTHVTHAPWPVWEHARR